ncbi:hypothetical protein TSTA_007920 [Talaromyces stipitatus ATCC 10500]|uniref:Uncharacterized protein n=1 Tax=Talaromyces stipitatus (strain ATCC 10500 / CBS 375.48 / QM 6759 / NRRL 1006) TaxID=441959 RepID=B8MVI1_TALSN|nr:uncharacterized protein TSTA_007920 [Talaromyces stipitatus ATCC 10500]EED11502.1 hypothetical protein TSTA_007920 [Talaromyces stipitatus ATCC 10500]
MEFDLGIESSILLKEPQFNEVINVFDLWNEMYSKTTLPSRKDIAMATFGDKSDQPKKNQRSETTSKPESRKCLCEQDHHFEDYLYVNIEKRKALRSVKEELQKKNKDKKKTGSSTDTKKNSENQESANLVYDSDEFVGLLNDTKPPVLQSVVSTILSALGRNADLWDKTLYDTGATAHITNN